MLLLLDVTKVGVFEYDEISICVAQLWEEREDRLIFSRVHKRIADSR